MILYEKLNSTNATNIFLPLSRNSREQSNSQLSLANLKLSNTSIEFASSALLMTMWRFRPFAEQSSSSELCLESVENMINLKLQMQLHSEALLRLLLPILVITWILYQWILMWVHWIFKI